VEENANRVHFFIASTFVFHPQILISSVFKGGNFFETQRNASAIPQNTETGKSHFRSNTELPEFKHCLTIVV